MTIDWRELLERRLNCRRALSHPDLPQATRGKFKKALDQAEAALVMQDAIAKR